MRRLNAAIRPAVYRDSVSPASERQHTLFRDAPTSPISYAEQYTLQDQPARPSGIRHSLATIPILPDSTISSEDDQLRTGIEAARSWGFRLDGKPRAALEQSLDSTLPNVQLHTDARADRLSRSVGALAFTAGRDIFFRSGMYRPSTREGVGLLAHEAAHVLQQAAEPTAATSAPPGIVVSDPDDASEQEARAAATSIVGGTTPQRPTASQAGRLDHAQLSHGGANSLIIQRATTAKTAAPKPTSTGQVADLPTNIMKALNDACASTASDKDRQDALNLIYDYLKSQKLIDNVEKKDFIYSGQNDKTYGLATPYIGQEAPKVIVEIFSKAFSDGPGAVYSTIRHELIHAEQYREQPSGTGGKTTSGDAFFYYFRGANNSVPVGSGYEQAIRGVISEIETYAWEIENSAATGTSSTFKKMRVDTLQKLYNQLIEYYNKLTATKQQKWAAYVQKAKTVAEQILTTEVTGFTSKSLSAPPAAKGKTKRKTPGVTKPPSRKQVIKGKATAARAKRQKTSPTKVKRKKP